MNKSTYNIDLNELFQMEENSFQATNLEFSTNNPNVTINHITETNISTTEISPNKSEISSTTNSSEFIMTTPAIQTNSITLASSANDAKNGNNFRSVNLLCLPCNSYEASSNTYEIMTTSTPNRFNQRTHKFEPIYHEEDDDYKPNSNSTYMKSPLSHDSAASLCQEQYYPQYIVENPMPSYSFQMNSNFVEVQSFEGGGIYSNNGATDCNINSSWNSHSAPLYSSQAFPSLPDDFQEATTLHPLSSQNFASFDGANEISDINNVHLTTDNLIPSTVQECVPTNALPSLSTFSQRNDGNCMNYTRNFNSIVYTNQDLSKNITSNVPQSSEHFIAPDSTDSPFKRRGGTRGRGTRDLQKSRQPRGTGNPLRNFFKNFIDSIKILLILP